MRIRSKDRYLAVWIWLCVLMVLALDGRLRVAEAATLWVSPAEGVSEDEAGTWAVTDSGSAIFTFALPSDIDDFVGAKVVLLPSADDTVIYHAHLALSQEGLGRDYYTDDVLVGEPLELVAEQITEVDVSGLLPYQDMLAPGLDYLTVRFQAQGLDSGEISPAARILGLRLEYREADVAAVDQEEQGTEPKKEAKSSSSYIISNFAASSEAGSTSSKAGAAKSGSESQAWISGQGAGATGTVATAAEGVSPRATIANTKFHVAGDIGVSKGVGIHEWAMGTTGNFLNGTGYFFIEDQDTADAIPLRLIIDQNSGQVQVAKFYVSERAGIGTTSPTHGLHIDGGGMADGGVPSPTNDVLRLEGTGTLGSGARFNFGDGDYAYVEEDADDKLTIYARLRTALMGGSVGIGTLNPTAPLTVAGRTKTEVLEITGGADLSERFHVDTPQDGTAPTSGMVVSIDPDAPGALEVSRVSYDRKVAGVISGAGGINPGMLMGQEGTKAYGGSPVALTGRVYCLADASRSRIQPGDLLTTSDTPGHAMKVIDHGRAQGAILGKAMTGLDDGQGLILVLVALQ